MKKRLSFMLLFLMLLNLAFSSCPQLCDSCNQATGQCQNCYASFQSNAISSYRTTSSCPCPSAFYYDQTLDLCSFCPVTCLNCTSYNSCTLCIYGYELNNNNQCVQTYSNQGQWTNMLIAKDLTSSKLANLDIQGFYLINHIASASISSAVQACSGMPNVTYFGLYAFPYNAQIIRSYFGLPQHDWMHIRFQFIAADRWTQTGFVLELNNQQSYNIRVIQGVLYAQTQTYSSSRRARNFCLSSDPDNLGMMNVYFSHKDSMLKIRVGTTLSTLTGAQAIDNVANYIFYGIRDVFVRAGSCPTNCKRCAGPDNCFQCNSPYVATPQGKCICDTTLSFQTELGRCIAFCPVGYVKFLLKNQGDQQQSDCHLCQQASEYLTNCLICSSNLNSPTCFSCIEGYFLYNLTCLSACPLAYYQTVSLNSSSGYLEGLCTKCSSNCLRCDANVCFECNSTYLLMNGSCTQSCSSRAYQDNQYCFACPFKCYTCSHHNYCFNCQDSDNYILFNGECVLKCEFYKNCSTSCDKSCSACFGQFSNMCTSCSNTSKLLQQGQCKQSCGLGYFALNSSICVPCLPPCLSCVNQRVCLTCQPSFALFNQQCISNCPIKHFPINQVCTSCPQNCLECVSVDICIKCAGVLQLYRGKCWDQVYCGLAMYFDERISTCMACQTGCEKCYRDLCYRCVPSLFLDNGHCMDACSTTKIVRFLNLNCGDNCGNGTYKICEWKDPLCDSYIFDVTHNQFICNKCIFMNPMLVLTDKICSFSCPINTALSLINNTVVCLSCQSNCISCSSTFCIRCSPLYVINPLVATQCISTCPDRYTSDGYQCVLCKTNCKTCELDGRCLSCMTTSNFILTEQNTCIIDDSCAANQYKAANGTCKTCITGCATCTSATQCSSCGLYFLTQMYLQGSLCQLACNAGFFKFFPTSQCKKCPVECVTCVSQTQCLTCIDTYYLLSHPIQPITSTTIGTCVSTCPLGYYNSRPLYSTFISKCLTCSSNCLSCFGPSQDQCLTCYGSFKLDHNSRCIQLCPWNKYPDTQGHCDWCHPSCNQCQGPAKFQCINCNEQSYLYRGICYKNSCPGSTYAVDYDNRICNPCQYGCQVCKSPYNCSVCTGGMYLFKGWCYKKCPQNTQPYISLITAASQCGDCSKKWANCSQCSQYKCQSCNGLNYLWYLSNTSLCVATCPYGYYSASDSLRQCLTCPNYCLSCTASECLTCVSGYVLINKACTNKCPAGQFYSTFFLTCKTCSINCIYCTNTMNCISCFSGYYIMRDRQVNSTAGYCTLTCGDYYYQDNDTLLCKQCPPTCASCTSYTSCTKCLSPYVLVNGYCTNNSTIPSCGIPNCGYCLTSNYCQTCQLPYYLLISYSPTNSSAMNSSCLSSCPSGYYESGRNCAQCNTTCAECDQGANDCTKCVNGFYLFSNRCWAICPVGYYSNLPANTCNQCDSTCFYCVNTTVCNNCMSGYYLYKGKCLANCPSGTFLSGLKCIPCLSSCKVCQSLSICIQCNQPYYGYQNVCVLQCPLNYYLDYDTLNCQMCSYPCQNCIQKTRCLTCVDEFILDSDGKTCVQFCQVGYYQAQISNFDNGHENYQCKACSQNCLSCFNSTFCLRCDSSSFLINGICLANCPIGTYGDLASRNCKQCGANCLACTSTGCIQCQNQTIFYQNVCILFCPSSTYPTVLYSYSLLTTISTCQSCISPCLTCNGSSLYNCLSCVSGYYLFNNNCRKTCMTGYWLNVDKNSCDACMPGCLACTDANSCNTCMTNWTKMGNNQCQPNNPCTQSNCAVCSYNAPSNDTICHQCVQPYYLVSRNLLPSTFNINTSALFGCVIACPSGTYATRNFSCLKCSTNCTSCTQNGCSSCVSGFYLYSNNCISACPSGFTLNNNACQPNICLYYNSINLCQQCLSPYLLQNGSCVISCRDGYFTSAGQCQMCDSSQYFCKTCSSLTMCLTCNTGYFIWQNQCTKSCPTGYYQSNNTCNLCFFSLQGCISCPNSLQCAQCMSPYYLYNKTCIYNCPLGFYSSSQTCNSCKQNCIQCLNQSSCTKCNNKTMLLNWDCLGICPVGYFQQSTLTGPLCSKCNLKCFSCSSINLCSQCQIGYFLIVVDLSNNFSSCVSSCPTGYYQSIDSRCLACSSECLTCNYQKCLSCPATKYLLNGKCISSCPSTYFSQQNICLECSPPCITCQSSASSCLTCYPGLILSSSLTCVTNCSSISQYYDSIYNQCRNCSIQCETCYGSFYDQCLTCKGQLALSNGICVIKCPDSYFRGSDTVCKPCDTTKCLTCQSSNDNCASCTYPKALLIDINGKGKCVDSCGSGYFYDSLSGQCQKCSSLCASCYSSTKCLTCMSNAFMYENRCIISCPAAYASVSTFSSTTCKQCPINCATCSYSSTDQSINCTTCAANYYLVNAQCYSSCPISTYISNTNCISCNIQCLTCNSPSICTSCVYPFVLSGSQCLVTCPAGYSPINYQCHPIYVCNGYLYQQKCYDACPVATYPSNTVCLDCSSLCLTCTSSSTCTQCQQGLYLYSNSLLSTTICVQSCPVSTYLNTQYCVSCPSSCASCYSINQIIYCLTCQASQILLNNICVNYCPSGYYQNGSICTPCNVQCLTCNANGCLICANAKYSLPSCQTSIQNGTCTISQYVDATTNACQDCNVACNSCYGTTAARCTSCKNVSSVVYYLYGSSCLADCPSGYTKNSTINKCDICSITNCAQCVSSTTCTQCVSGYILALDANNIQKCIQSCSQLNTPIQTYITTSNFTCISCSSSILYCIQCYSSISSTSIICTKCRTNYYLYLNQCVTTCPFTTYINGLQCSKCLLNCATCLTSNTCVTCAQPYLLYQNNCVTNCPIGYLNSSNSCVSCTANCKTCANTGCLECISPNKLDSSNICTLCQDGYFINSNSPNCQQCNSNCLTCSLTASNCVICQSSLILFSNTCISACPSNYYIDNTTSTLICTPCTSLTPNCGICSSITCLKCVSPLYLTSNSTCVSVCPTGYYPDNQNYVCVQCAIPNCLQCQSSTTCTKCSTNFFIFNSLCISACPQGYAPSTDVNNNKLCTPCLSGCVSCPVTVNNCQICGANLQAQANGSCTLVPNNCLSNQYLNSLGTCVNCQQSCLTCYGGLRTNCITCNQGELLQSDGSCMNQCAADKYYNSTNTYCSSCNAKYGINCTLCDQYNCYACSSGLLSTDSQSCISVCTGSTYLLNGACSTCPQYCLTCISSTYCTACLTSTYAYYQNLCYKVCPTGSYNSNGCLPCNSTSCVACLNSANNCSSCKTPYLLNYPNQCVLQCLSGYYEGSTTKSCLACISPCATCTSATNCTTCITSLYLYSSTCTASCPTGTYSTNDMKCIACLYPCLQCQMSSNQCLTCFSGFSYVAVNHTCINQCPNGNYMSSLSVCTPCVLNNCLQCDVVNCFKCNALYLSTSNSNGTYIVKCSIACDDYYFPVNETCQKCISNCVTCSSNSNCQKCSLSYSLYNNQCFSTCPITTYVITSTNGNSCYNCSSKCNSCTSNSSCTVCTTSYYLLNGLCVSTCPSGFYPRSADSSCQPCSLMNCLTCQMDLCTICRAGYFAFANNGVVLECVQDCGHGYYANSQNGLCELCLNGCQTCTNAIDCQQCASTKAILNSTTIQCVNNCPVEYFNNTNSGTYQCQQCNNNCKVCSSSFDCQQCAGDYLLISNSSTTTCTASCPSNYYQKLISTHLHCLECLSSCLTCNSLTNCLTCIQSYTLVNGVCIPDNCVNCDNCDYMTQPPVCLNCTQPYYLYKVKCFVQCPVYYYGVVQQSIKKCDKCVENCVKCLDNNTCQQCIPDYIFVQETKTCQDQAVYQYGVMANMSDFTSNLTATVAKVYLGTSVGPVAFGQMSTTYFNIQFTQFLFFHQSSSGGNKQMTQFLNSLSSMSLTNGGNTTTTNSTPSQVQARRLLSTQTSYSSSFIQTNASIFFLMFAFLGAYLAIYLFQRFANQTMRVSCHKTWFYLDTICNFMQKRFKWIYFDFIMWTSYLPFLFFSVVQLQNFSFNNFAEGFSSLLALVIIAVYPLYPFFICYQLKQVYNEICIDQGQQQIKQTLTQMSLSPYLYKVKRPSRESLQIQPRLLTLPNLRLIYYPLKYIRKLAFVIIAALVTQPITTVSTLMAINIVFIIYMIALRPRVMPYMVFDLIIQFVLLAFQVFLLVYLVTDGSKIAVMSIITHAIGFITANLSLVTAIVLNLIAYYKIFQCIKDLIAHIAEKANEKFEADNKFEVQKKFLDPMSNLFQEKDIGNMIGVGDDSDTDEDDSSFRLSANGRKFAQNLGQKELLLNGIDPIKYVKKITKGQNFEFQQKERALKMINEDDATDSDDMDENAFEIAKKLELNEKNLALNKIHPVKFAKQMTKDQAPLQKRYNKFDQKHVDKKLAKMINDNGLTDSDDDPLDQDAINIVKKLQLNEKQLAFNQINPIKFFKQDTKKDAPLQEQYKKFDEKNVDKKVARMINEENMTDSDDSQIDEDIHNLAKKLQLNEKQLAFNQVNPIKFLKEQTKKDAPLHEKYQKFDEKNMDKRLASKINEQNLTDSQDDSSIDQDVHVLAKKLNLNQKQLAHNQINPLKFLKQQTKKDAALQQVYKQFDQKHIDKALAREINNASQTSSQDEQTQDVYRLARDLKLDEKQLAFNKLNPLKVMASQSKNDQKLQNVRKAFDQKEIDGKIARMINDNGETSQEQQSNSQQEQQENKKIAMARVLKLDQKQLAFNNINPMKLIKQATKINPMTNQPKMNSISLAQVTADKRPNKKKLLDKQLANRNQMKREISQNSHTDQDDNEEDIRLSKFNKDKLKNMTEKEMIMEGLDPMKVVKKLTKQAMAKKMVEKKNNNKNKRVYSDQMPDFKVSSQNKNGIANALKQSIGKLKQSTTKKQGLKKSQRVPSQQSIHHKNSNKLIQSQSQQEQVFVHKNLIKSTGPRVIPKPTVHKIQKNILGEWDDLFQPLQQVKKPLNKQVKPMISLQKVINNRISNQSQVLQDSLNSQQSSQMALNIGLLKKHDQEIQNIQLKHQKSKANIVSNRNIYNQNTSQNQKIDLGKLENKQKNYKQQGKRAESSRVVNKPFEQPQFDQFDQVLHVQAINQKKFTDKKYKRVNNDLKNVVKKIKNITQEDEIEDINQVNFKEIKEAKHKRNKNSPQKMNGKNVNLFSQMMNNTSESMTFQKGKQITTKNMGNEKYMQVIQKNKEALRVPNSYNPPEQFEQVDYQSRPRPSQHVSNAGSDHSDNQYSSKDVRIERNSTRHRLRAQANKQSQSNEFQQEKDQKVQSKLGSMKNSKNLKVDRPSKILREKLKIDNLSENDDEIQNIDM